MRKGGPVIDSAYRVAVSTYREAVTGSRVMVTGNHVAEAVFQPVRMRSLDLSLCIR